jgi:hypothetical protein
MLRFFIISMCLAAIWPTAEVRGQVLGGITEHTMPPARRIVETTYDCGGRQTKLSVRYTRSAFEIVSGRRNGVPLSSAYLAQANTALRALDALIELNPQCGPTFDTVFAVGLIGRRRAIIFLVWSDHGFRTAGPEFIE